MITVSLIELVFIGEVAPSEVGRTRGNGIAASTPQPLRFGFLGRADIVRLALLEPARLLNPSRMVISGIATRSSRDAIDFLKRHELNATVYASYEALLVSPTIDCIYVALPTSLHFEWTALALSSGKHVLLEKPLTSNAEQAEALVALARSRGRVLMHALHNLHHPMTAQMYASARQLGRLKEAEAEIIMPKAWIKQRGSRYRSDLAGGASMDLAGYVLSALFSTIEGDSSLAASAPWELHSVAAKRWSKDEAIDESMHGRLYISGVLCRFKWSLIGRKTPERKQLRVVGSNGSMVAWGFQAPQFGNTLTMFAPDGTVLSRQSFPQKVTTYGRQLAHFVRMVERVELRHGRIDDSAFSKGQHVTGNGAHAVRLMRLIDAIYVKAGMSLRKGGTARAPTLVCPAALPTHTREPCDQAFAKRLGSNGVDGLQVVPAVARSVVDALTVDAPLADGQRARLGRVLQKKGAAIVRAAVSASALQRISSAINAIGRHNLPGLDAKRGAISQPHRVKAVLKSLRGVSAFRDSPRLLATSLAPVYAIAEAALAGSIEPGAMLSLGGMQGASASSIIEEVHLNAALPGSHFQNPHFDQAFDDPEMLLTIDVPLADVTDVMGPLELWPGTHALPYEYMFSARMASKLRRERAGAQYDACWCETNEVIGRRYPSVRFRTTAGDVVVRYPSTWHRGTPNRHPTRVRDMVTFVWRRKPAPTPVWMGVIAAQSLALPTRQLGQRSVGRPKPALSNWWPWTSGRRLSIFSPSTKKSVGGRRGWRVTDAEWAASQVRVPVILETVPTEHRARCERVLRNLPDAGFAQAWQDHFLWRNFFANMGERKGVYVNIGTNDAVKISNTVFFDVCLGWSGVCYKPQKAYHRTIRQSRSCKLVPHCVMGKPVNLTAVGTGGLMTLTAKPPEKGKWGPHKGGKGGKGGKAKGGGGRGRQGAVMQCVGFRESLEALHLGSRTVDLLSIDIEGNEPSVLKCLPWKDLDIAMVLIETNKFRDLRPVDMFFHAHGYVNAQTFLYKDALRGAGHWLDNLYVKVPGSGAPLARPIGTPRCDKADRDFNPDCAPWRDWAQQEISDGWGECNE